ncbi:MAG: S9 family peptidase, partial [Planctomycetota bacterium]
MRERLLFSFLCVLSACEGGPSGTDANATTKAFVPPPVRRENVVDDYHGTQVEDPYRWLEDQDGEEVAEFVAAQNRASRAFLDATFDRQAIRDRLEELWNYARYEPPMRRGDRWFWWKNDGLSNQAVLYTGADPSGEGEVLLDPNTLSADGTIAISGLQIADDGRRVVYGTSKSGSDWRTYRVLDVETKTTLPDEVAWSKFSAAALTKDGKGFFYQRYQEPKAGETFQATNKQPQLCYHEVGTAADTDRVVYERPDQPDFGFGPRVTDDGRFLLIGISQGTAKKNRVAYVDLQQEGWPVQPLWMDLEAHWSFLGNDGDVFYF